MTILSTPAASILATMRSGSRMRGSKWAWLSMITAPIYRAALSWSPGADGRQPHQTAERSHAAGAHDPAVGERAGEARTVEIIHAWLASVAQAFEPAAG